MTGIENDADATLEPLKEGEPRLLHEFFERQVRLQPDAIAVEFKDQALTYFQLNRVADQVAAFLRARGVVRGSLVALHLDKSSALVGAMLGVLKAGAGYIPLDPKFPTGRIVSILEDADATIVITDRSLGGDLATQTSAEVIFLHDDLSLDPDGWAPQPAAESEPEDVCYVIYTSGSTGRPKGVVIEHRNAVNFVHALWTVYRLTPQDRIYQGFSMAFDASVEEIWAALAIGGTLVIPTSDIARSALDAAAFINDRRITYFSTVPSLLSMMTTDLPTVRLLVLGGEACSPELVNRWATPTRRLLNTYGPTETTVVATAADCTPGQPVTIGGPLPGYTAYVLDESLRQAQPGEDGELFIGGASVARGYLNRAELTAELFIPNPFAPPGAAPSRLYRTRDLVRLTEEGTFQFLGRADAQIKIRGFRIELSEIEAVLMEQPAIQAAAVTVVEFGNLKELAAYVVLDTGATDLDRDGVAGALRSRLPEYMIPRYLDIVRDLPQMTSGKVDRKLLPPPRTIFGRTKHDIAAPATDTERAVVEVWQRVFQVSPISIDDDFFLDLRGHSLFAAQAVTELRSRLATVHVSIPDLYEYRTVRRLARHLDTAKAAMVAAQERASAAESGRAAPAAAGRAPLPWFCVACVVLQFFVLMVFYAVVCAPLVIGIVLILQYRAGEVDLATVLNIGTVVGFGVWPSWLVLSIAVKWLVIGRYRPGRYPVWGFYYLRWWIVTRFQGLSWAEMFVGTPLMSLYYRAMGARIGRRCSIDTPYCSAFDLVTVGEDTSIGSETQMLGYRVEDGWLIIGRVTIGSECFVGAHCSIGLDVGMQNRSLLDDMSHLADGTVIAADRGMCGSPCIEAQVDVDALQNTAGPARYRPGRTLWFGFLHLILIYAMGYLLILSAAPGLALVAFSFFRWGALWAVGAAIVAVPLSLLWYLALIVIVKRVAIGRIEPGIYLRQSKDYLRCWFLAYMLSNTRNLVAQLYATMYLPTLLRLLGAKIGYGAEISTAMRVVPDLLEIGDGAFLADACVVGGHRTHLGLTELRPNRIGEHSFIGNSALLPAGTDIGNDCLIGVMSTPPRGYQRVPDETRWLGSPGFELPHTQEVSEFTEKQTFTPVSRLIEWRAAVEFVRIVLPDVIAVVEITLFCIGVALAYEHLPLWGLAVAVPLMAFVFAFVTVAIVAAVKKLLIGTFEPIVTPFWSRYVWLNDVVNASFETAAAAAMTPFMGTLFAAPCLRMMGCKVGRWVFIETTLFSEFDLVEIGDYAALNLGATVQTHLFEDRVMKADYLRIGRDCSVGNMAVVLYATEMQRGSTLAPLSVLMKGEVLPPYSRWTGIPTRPEEPRPPMPAAPAIAMTPIRASAIPKAAPDERPAVQGDLIKSRVDRLLASTPPARPSEGER